jgi:hypothetical protein
LGPWLTEQPYTTREFYYHPASTSIIYYNGDELSRYIRYRGRETLYHKTETIQTLPMDAVRTSAWRLGPFLSSKAITAHTTDHTETAAPISDTFHSYVTNLPDHIKRTLGNLLDQQIQAEYWMTQLQEGTVSIASDGSVATKRGYYAVVFHTETEILRFQGPCDGAPALMSSFRAELAGILASLYFLNALTTFTGRQFTEQVPIYCDNIAAVKTAKVAATPTGLKAHLSADYDIITEIRSEIGTGIPLNPTWVKAHQDDHEPVADLTLDAQLNCLADKDADRFRRTITSPLAPIDMPPEFPTTSAYAIVNNVIVTKDL